MAGIYIHIPFCKQACHYCNFHFSTQLNTIDALYDALLKELVLRQDFFDKTKPLDTIYLGGGTPSLLSPYQLQKLFETIGKHYNIGSLKEVTIETNPDDITKNFVRELKDTPINRLSIGIQSFFDRDLTFFNRLHSSQQADKAVKLAQDSGIENITIDFIYGIQTLPDDDWLANLEKVNELEIPHFSAYSLTIEEKTALAHKIKTQQVEAVDEQKNARHFELLLNFAKENNFEAYEISNYCKPSFEAVHNSNYWKGESYLGIGPSAHSYDGQARYSNVANNNTYIKQLQQNEIVLEKEELSIKDIFNERLLTGLRTKWGVNIQELNNKFGEIIPKDFRYQLDKYVISGHLIIQDNSTLLLTDKGKLIADAITSDLFVV